MEPIVWSTSKVDAASACLYKYNKVYNEKIRQVTPALTLGTNVHEIMADELISKNEDENILLDRLDSQGDLDPEVYSMVPNISSFVKKWNALMAKDNLEPTIEKQYAVDRNFKEVGFFDKDAYIRGVFDLWAYDERNKRLLIVDHKTNKACLGKKAVWEYPQLNLYIVMLTKMFNLDWDSAYIALHFLRHGKVVSAWVTREEMDVFFKKYTHLLTVLEERIVSCYERNDWPTCPGFYCNWCGFKGECPR